MTSQNERRLHSRMVQTASQGLAAKGWISPVDVLVGIGWLSPDRVEAWRRGQVPYLERVVNAGLGKISTAMCDLHRWAASQGLKPSRTEYVHRKTRAPLQFSKSGEHALEERYRTHWVSQRLTDRKARASKSDAPKPPQVESNAGGSPDARARDLLVYLPLRESRCESCQAELGRRAFITLVEGSARCMKCSGLERLVYLPAGDALLTRHVRKATRTHAVVIKWSRARRRYERQGLLVEEEALRRVARDLGRDLPMLEELGDELDDEQDR
jgi:hypothetical protein